MKRKYLLFLFSMLFALIFFTDKKCMAADSNSDLYKLTDEDKKVIIEYLNTVNTKTTDLIGRHGGSEGKLLLTNYIIFYLGDKSIGILTTPAYETMVLQEISSAKRWCFALKPEETNHYYNNAFLGVYNPETKLVSEKQWWGNSTFTRYPSNGLITGPTAYSLDYDVTVIASNGYLLDTDGNSFFLPSPLAPRWMVTVGKIVEIMKPMVAMENLIPVGACLLCCLAYPLFWKKLLESLLPSEKK